MLVQMAGAQAEQLALDDCGIVSALEQEEDHMVCLKMSFEAHPEHSQPHRKLHEQDLPADVTPPSSPQVTLPFPPAIDPMHTKRGYHRDKYKQ